MSLTEILTQAEATFDAKQARIAAFVPEARRWERLEHEANALSQRFPNDKPPLYGKLVGIKDIFHVDGIPTRAGSSVDPAKIQGTEADIVTRLKNAGALILGKTVTTEFAYFAPGPTRNPHNVDHTPGGSSSGSAAAVGGGMVELALGTQTIGSVNRPAAYCGCVGYKPTYERVSRAGVIPLSESFDHVGFFVPRVGDLFTMARAVIDNWGRPKTFDLPVILVPEGAYLEHAETAGLANFHESVVRLEAAGCTVKRVRAFDDFDALVARHQALMAYDCMRTHLDPDWYDPAVYHWKTAELIERGKAVNEDDLPALRESREALRRELRELGKGSHVWVSPSAPSIAPKGLLSTGDPIMNLPWTHAGVPTVNVPSGIDETTGLSFGLQMAGKFGGDEALLGYAQKIERILR